MNFSVLRFRNFRTLWLGQIISQAGDALYYVSFMFMVRELTGSPLMVGLVGAMEALPWLLIGPIAGVVADRVDRKLVMLLSDILSSVILLSFAVPFMLNLRPSGGLILVFTFLMTSVRTFFFPAKTAAIPMLVPTEEVGAANAFSQMTTSTAMLCGLGLSAGVLAVLFGLSPKLFYVLTISLNALSFFWSAAFIARLPKIVARSKDEVEAAHPITDFFEGLKFIKGRGDISVLIWCLTLFRFGAAPFFVVYTESNKVWFDGRPQNLAIFELSFFAGMVVGSVAMTKLKPKRPTRWFAIGLTVIGASVVSMAFFHSIFAFVVSNVIAGVACMLADIPIMTYLQTSIPNKLQGRVNGVQNMVATAAMPIGNILMGLCLARIGVMAGYLAMGVVMAISCMLGCLSPSYWNALMPSEPAGDSVSLEAQASAEEPRQLAEAVGE